MVRKIFTTLFLLLFSGGVFWYGLYLASPFRAMAICAMAILIAILAITFLFDRKTKSL